MVTEVYLLITVSPGVALVPVAAVLVRRARVVLRNALASAARLLGAGLDLQLLAVLALVLGGTGALVVPGYGGLGAGPAVLTRLVLALVLVQVTQPARPALLAGAGVVPNAVLALAVLAPVLQALVNVHGA